jgi:hypothetical protein
MAFSSVWDRRNLQQRILPEIRAVMRRHEPVLQEWLGGGPCVLELPPAAVAPPRAAGHPIPCQWCYGQRKILEPSALGFVPVLCERCGGTGLDPA